MNEMIDWNQELFNKINGRMTVVSAPAGFGKSTLIQQWCRISEVQSVWFPAKKSLRQPNRFWQELDKVLHSGSGNKEFAIVIDDFHEIDLNRQEMMRLKDELPEFISLILVTRYQPQITSNIITADDLRFDKESSRYFFEHKLGESLSDMQLSFLHEWTRGWIAGMQLLSLIVKEYGSLSTFQRYFCGEHLFLKDYFNETLQSEPAELKKCLMQTVCLNSFNESLCNAIIGSNSLREVLKRSLYISKIGSNYRFEPLFQAFLEGELTGVPEREKKCWYLKASDWYAKKGDIEAVTFAIKANQPEHAAVLMKKFANLLFEPPYWKTTETWKRVVKSLCGKEKAEMLLLFGWVEWMNGSYERLNETLVELESILQKNQMENNLKGELLLLQSLNAFLLKDIIGAVKLSRMAFSNLADGGIYLHKGIHLNDREAQLIRGRNGLGGCPERVLKYFESYEREQGLFSESVVGYGKCIYAEAAYEVNKMKEAGEIAKEAVRIGFETGHLSLIVPSVAIYAKILQNNNRHKEAFRLLNDAKACAGGQDRLWELLLYALEIRMLIKKKELRKAEELVYHLLNKSQGAPEQLHEFESLTYARMLIEVEDFERAKVFLEELLFEAESRSRYGSRVEILTLLGIVNWKTRRIQIGIENVQKAMPFAEKEGYVRTFLDEGKPMYNLLCRMDHRSGYVKKLLELFEREYQFSAANVRLTKRELDVLKLIGEGMTNKQMADEINVTVGTIKGYASSLFKKLNVKKRTQAVMRAKEMNLL